MKSTGVKEFSGLFHCFHTDRRLPLSFAFGKRLPADGGVRKRRTPAERRIRRETCLRSIEYGAPVSEEKHSAVYRVRGKSRCSRRGGSAGKMGDTLSAQTGITAYPCPRKYAFRHIRVRENMKSGAPVSAARFDLHGCARGQKKRAARLNSSRRAFRRRSALPLSRTSCPAERRPRAQEEGVRERRSNGIFRPPSS